MEHKQLLKICRQYLGDNYRYRKVIDQIKQYISEYGLSYEQIANVLAYWYDVRHNDPSQSGGGIGIVPHIYKEALQYWEDEQQYRENVKNIPVYSPIETEHVLAASPYIAKPKTLKLFELK